MIISIGLEILFPSIVFGHVKRLGFFDIVPFEHEFFLRIARFFPSLTELSVFNLTPKLHSSDDFDSNGNQLYPIVEYPHLISLVLSVVILTTLSNS